MIEEPLGRQSCIPSPSLLMSAEARPYLNKLERFAQMHGCFPDRSTKHSADIEDALNKMAELDAQQFAKGVSEDNLKENWKLTDCHQCAMVGGTIQIEGLKSDQGKLLNGKQGRVISHDRVPSRMIVEVILQRLPPVSARRSIKSANLKTLGGILRTNAFGHGGGEYRQIYKDLSRVNHACFPYRNSIRWFGKTGKAFLIADDKISKGEEISIDYISGEVDPLSRL